MGQGHSNLWKKYAQRHDVVQEPCVLGTVKISLNITLKETWASLSIALDRGKEGVLQA